jgi:hypothetical protein
MVARLIHRKLPCRNAAIVIGEMTSRNKEHAMMDVLMIALAIGFFALAIGYTYACERL